MKIRVEKGAFDESEVVLRCKELDNEMSEILTLLQARLTKLIAFLDGDTYMLAPGDICYAEAVDGKTFLYTTDRVLQIDQSLVALQNSHEKSGFLRISKSQLVNLYHVARLRSMPNSRIEITLKTGEKLIVSRHYIYNMKDKLGLLNKEDDDEN